MTDEQVQRVLVVAAHPDDVDFASAGTIATWTDAGIEVSYCVVTDGDAGGFDPEVPRSAISGIRQDEQRKAAATLGVTDVEFLGYPDGLRVASEFSFDLLPGLRTLDRRQPHRDRVHKDDSIAGAREPAHDVILRMLMVIPPVFAAEADY